MAAYLSLVQQLLAGFATPSDVPANISASVTASATAAATSATSTPFALPTDLSSLFTLLLSFSALRDWAKLAVVGGAIELARRFVFGGYHSFINSFFITAHFEDQDASYGGSPI
jgi:chaperone BCS1